MVETPQKAHVLPITGETMSHPYEWGGSTLIPRILGFNPEPGVPYAEHWLGSHSKAPSNVELPDGTHVKLDLLIKEKAEEILGKEVKEKFGDLPFLFKLLDAKEMLSIQVHPDKAQAKEGFEREEREGVAASDPKRSYKDSNQKSEFAVAMGDFWLLHGFRSPEQMNKVLDDVKELSPLKTYFGNGDHKKLYEYVMVGMPQEESQRMLGDVAERILPQLEAGALEKTSPDYWAAKAMKDMKMQPGNYDKGIFSIYFLNLVNMRPGEAIFQEAGMLHAYLEGPIIEVMTTSDNVVRGGITPKYIDVDELMKLVRFESTTPNILEPRTKGNEEFYDTPSDEFAVSRIHMPYGNTSEGRTLSLGKGKSVIVFANTSYTIEGTGRDTVFRTRVPRQGN